ncbi:MAG: caspase family protein [Prochloraceae cyanobacterium]|nr:caspase family protein [Prochloraceae cyanobacterium]
MPDMGFERRTFLQQTGLALLTLAISETGLSRLGDDRSLAPLIKRSLSALAQPTSRKLALLVGINQYSRSRELTGCLTDVELQKELLIHRFGFNASDIVTLTDRQATRENIETAFIEHLSKQAKTTDVVVFHFSGYGCQAKIPESDLSEVSSDDEITYKQIDTLVPTDGISLAKGAPGNNLLEETLALLASSLATDRLTMVLDTSYANTSEAIRGSLVSRSLPAIVEKPSPEELAFQQRLRLNYKQTSKKKTTGIILKAAGENQIATEKIWDGFSAGLFTYALTQYLWQVTPASTVRVAIARSEETMESASGDRQQPQLIGTNTEPLFTYYLLPDRTVGAEGFISAVEDKETASIQLTGIPVTILRHYESGSCLTAIPLATSQDNTEVQPSEPVVLQIRSRQGLSAKAKLLDNTAGNSDRLQVGQLLRESIRVLPRNLGLTIALDRNLERIERVDATSAFANIAAVSSVVTAGEQAADCLFGKIKKAEAAKVSENLDSESVTLKESSETEVLEGYGLLSVSGEPLYNRTEIASEAVKNAVSRLVPQLQTLLAAKLWRLTMNEGSSGLRVKATLEIIDGKDRVLISRQTARHNSKSSSGENSSVNEGDTLTEIESGTQIQYRLENYSDRPLYFLLLGIDAEGNAIAFYSPQSKNESAQNGGSSSLKNNIIPKEESVIIPQPTDSVSWIISTSQGIAKLEIIFSIAPFENTIKALAVKKHLKGEKEQVVELPNPLEVARALLSDLHGASAVSEKITASSSDVWALDVNTWGTLSFVYQVV